MYIYGTHPVEELLLNAPAQVESIYSVDPGGAGKIADYAARHNVRIERRHSSELDRLAEGGNHQGIVAETLPFQYTPLHQILDETEDASRACVVVLDQVQDPQNVGAVLRSAAGMGADAVIIPKDRQAPITDTVVRASSGLAYRIPVVRITNVARTLEELKDHGWWAVGAIAEQGQPVWDIDFEMKTALVLGSEESGLRRLVGETCDFRALIPMKPGVESLNVASAATIFLYEVARQWAKGGA